ncbi:MAG: SEL1-like repeat protein, partial [Methylocystis sp.]|nr:SEL1-like repeat protein [Methylocystis sp.]
MAKPGPAKRFDEINERIDHVHKSLAARIDKGASSQKAIDASQLEQLVTKLAKQIDSALGPKAAHPAFDELGRKIERLQERLEQPKDGVTIAEIDQLLSRPANSKQFRELAELVGQLAHKVDKALNSEAGGGALLSLERHIDKLSQRLDHTDQNMAGLADIERTIGGLFARMEETRNGAAEAAERAVRCATQDMLREAANAEPGSLNGLLKRELTDLRKNQDETSTRTHATLAAVHETLERVVDRLALFEEELTEIRDAPPAGAAATKSAPKIARLPMGQQARAADLATDNIDDFLVEPGAGRRASGRGNFGPDRGGDPKSRGEGFVQADFIAAARRAAHQTAADGQAEQAQNSKTAAGGRDTAASDADGGIGRAILARKRPLLLGLGALVLLVGAYQIAKVGIAAPPSPAIHSGAGDASGPAGDARPDAPADAKPTAKAAPQAEPAPPALAAPAAPIAPAPAPRMIGPPTAAPTSTAPATDGKSAGAAIDAAPVGTIDKSASGAPAQQRDAPAAIRALAKLGDAAAQYELAARYAEGRDLARDPKSAAQWFEKAASQGFAPAQYRLGSHYEKGVGVERDYAQARKWYLRAAERGNARAMHNLAVLFAEGGDGKPDYAAAAVWFRKAAELGVRDSQYNLAILHARGLGVGQSFTQSYVWFAVAASQGDADAGRKRDDVGERLDSKDLAAAKALVDNFKPRTPDKASNDVAPPPGGWGNVKTPVDPNGKSSAKPKVSAL